MMLAAKHFDPVLGVDIHLVFIPPSPSPVPIPHPFVGFIFDAMEYIPISIPLPVPFVGVVPIPLNASVKVNGVYRAMAGTMGRTVPGIHFPLGTGWGPPPPSNQCEMFMGSATVEWDGDAASYMALPTLDCQSIGMPPIPRLNAKKRSKFPCPSLPTGVVLPIAAGPPVYIGGPPTISLMALGFKAGFAAAGKMAGYAMRKVKGSSMARAVAKKIHKAADKAADKLKLGQRARNKIHRAVCKVTGHPVDVATGKLFTELVDFELPGSIPLRWERVWYSSSEYIGPLGYGWHHSYDLGLIADEEAVSIRLADGRGVAFPLLAVGEESFNELEGLTLLRDEESYALRDREGKTHRFARVGRGAEQFLVSIEDEAGAQLRFLYSSSGRLVTLAGDNGQTISIAWNDRNRISEIRGPDPSRPGEACAFVRYDYNEQDDLIAAYDALDQPFRYEYANHLLVKETDRRGYSFFFRYDAHNANARCVETWSEDGLYAVRLAYEPDQTKAEFGDGGVWIYKHNGQGIVTELIDPYGKSTQFNLDELGRVVEEVDPNGNATTLEYDDNGEHIRRVSCVGHPSPPEHVDPDPPDANSYELPETPLEWEMGEILSPATGDGPDQWILSQVPPVVREAALRVRAQVNIDGDPTEHFDALGRLVERHYRDGTNENWTYDAEGNVVAYQDRDSSLTRQDYASWNLLVSEADALGQTTRYEYSKSEELTRLVDPGGTEHRFDYDLKDRNTAISINGQPLESYAYDAADNLVERRDGQGRTLVRYEIGPGNVDVRRILADGETHTFEYDKQGRLTVAASPTGVTKLAYNEEGVQVKDQRDGQGVEHTFDEGGTLLQTTYFGRFTVAYGWDPDNPDVIVVTDPAGAKHRFHIGWDGEVFKSLSNGANELSLYDGEGRCLSKQVWSAEFRDTPWQRYYRYSPGGDLTDAQDSVQGTTHYEYDAAHRLRRRTRRGQSQDYVFDRANNLIEQPHLSGVTMGGANQLAQANGDVFTYNERGHIARRTGRCGEIRYHYNALDLLTRIEINGEVWEATYDPLCRRVSKTWRGQTTHYWWDDFRLAVEQRPDGAFRLYIYPDHKSLVPFMFVDYATAKTNPDRGRAYFIFTNQIGVPIRVEDAQGRIVWAAETDPFGRAHVTVDEGIHTFLRFPGHYFDPETELHYNRFRYYSPELGRYLQVDPLGIDDDVNLYSYSNNPLVEVDIDGLGRKGYGGGKPKAKRKKGKNKKGQKKKASARRSRAKPKTWKIKDKFPAGSRMSRQLRRFVKAWNEEIKKAGGQMRRRKLSLKQERASNAWKKKMRKKQPRRFKDKVVGHTPDAAAGGPVAHGRAMALDDDVNSAVGGSVGRKPVGYTYGRVTVIR